MRGAGVLESGDESEIHRALAFLDSATLDRVGMDHRGPNITWPISAGPTALGYVAFPFCLFISYDIYLQGTWLSAWPMEQALYRRHSTRGVEHVAIDEQLYVES